MGYGHHKHVDLHDTGTSKKKINVGLYKIK